eukprot:353880-Chlamydomonas_euryale.AAC.22
MQGVLLYGPPGTGKTLIARAVAAQTNATFLKLAGPQLVQMFIGDGAKMVRDAFALAKEKNPCIIFIDEIDAIGTKRFDSELSGDREVQRTMLELLNQLDGFSSSEDVKVIAATNRADILDPALMRSGRLDRKIEFPHPNEDARAKILRIHSRKMNISGEVNFEELARSTDDFNAAQLKACCVEAGMLALRRDATDIHHEDFVEGITQVQAKKKTNLHYYATTRACGGAMHARGGTTHVRGSAVVSQQDCRMLDAAHPGLQEGLQQAAAVDDPRSARMWTGCSIRTACMECMGWANAGLQRWAGVCSQVTCPCLLSPDAVNYLNTVQAFAVCYMLPGHDATYPSSNSHFREKALSRTQWTKRCRATALLQHRGTDTARPLNWLHDNFNKPANTTAFKLSRSMRVRSLRSDCEPGQPSARLQAHSPGGVAAPPTHSCTLPSRILRVAVRIVTNSSADDGWMPTTSSSCDLVMPCFTATAKPCMISAAVAPTLHDRTKQGVGGRERGGGERQQLLNVAGFRSQPAGEPASQPPNAAPPVDSHVHADQLVRVSINDDLHEVAELGSRRVAGTGEGHTREASTRG